MKRFYLIALLCIYSLSTFGIGIKQFYCCGILKSTNITFAKKDSNEKCLKGDATGGCCQTRYKSLKVKDSHVAAGGNLLLAKYLTVLHIFDPLQVTTLAIQSKCMANSSHAPPFEPAVPVYILYCLYRI